MQIRFVYHIIDYLFREVLRYVKTAFSTGFLSFKAGMIDRLGGKTSKRNQ